MDSGCSDNSDEGLTLRAVSTHHLGPIDWQINRGECVALGGASGSGKSLLLRAIADLDPHDGEVCLDGVRATTLKGHEWRRRVGLLPAEPAWWAERIGEHTPDAEQVAAMLGMLGLPMESIDWEVVRCSTGERQRLALIRLLLNRPQVLLLDEPTASLDRQGVAQVERLVEGYRREHQAVVVWVGHDPEQLARVASRRFAIDNDALVEVVA